MSWIETTCHQLKEPDSYLGKSGPSELLPSPLRPLIFARTTRHTLQQNALENRSHHRFVLIFNLKTSGHVHVDNRSLPFHPGEALLIHPYQFHHFSHLAGPDLLWMFCTFELTPEEWLDPLRDHTIQVSMDTEPARDELLKQYLSAKNHSLIQTALLNVLLLLKQDRQSAANDLPPEPSESLLRTVNRLLFVRRKRPVTTADVAKALNLSESRVRVLFKEAAGVPLGSYIQNVRLTRAMELLKNSRLSIADVAEEAGFGSPQAFSRLFRNETGQTPRSYRCNVLGTPAKR